MFVFTFLIAVLGFYWIIFRLKRQRLYDLAKKIPGVHGYPVLGVIPNYWMLDTKDYKHEIFRAMAAGGAITKSWFGPKLCVFSDDPDCIHTVFNSQHALKKPAFFYDGFNIKHGLLASSGTEYDKHKKIINRAFTPSMLNLNIPVLKRKTGACIEKLREKVGAGEFDIFDTLGACTLDSFFTRNYNYDKGFYDSELVRVLCGFKELVTKRIYNPFYNFKPFYKVSNVGKKVDNVNRVVRGVIEDVRRHNAISPNSEESDIVINLMLNPKFDLSEEEIMDELTTFIYVTFETSSTTIGSILLLLAQHKDIQQKVIQEIDEVVASVDAIDKETLNNFSYLELVMKEAMRLFPSGGIIGRETTAEFDLGGYTIPEGTSIFTVLYRMHRSEKLWGSDAHLFKPERFAPESFEKIHPHAYAPFAGGKRTCTGAKYSVMFMKVFLINFFKNFTVDTSLKFDELRVELMPTVAISQGYLISINNREKALK